MIEKNKRCGSEPPIFLYMKGSKSYIGFQMLRKPDLEVEVETKASVNVIYNFINQLFILILFYYGKF
jgi:hypothetical protein